MDNKLEGAKRYAEEQYGELVIDVKHLCNYGGKDYFNIVFSDNPVYGIGLPSLIKLSNNKYTSTSFDEYKRIIMFSETQKHNQG